MGQDNNEGKLIGSYRKVPEVQVEYVDKTLEETVQKDEDLKKTVELYNVEQRDDV